MFFGAPVTETISSAAKGIGSFFSKVWGKVPQSYKGITAGGEEFTSKFDKLLDPELKKPNFMHGTMTDYMKTNTIFKPLLLIYLSGDDVVSKEFEQKVLT